MENLKQLRIRVETGNVIEVWEHTIDGYTTLYSIVRYNTKCDINRYFKVGDKWCWSLDHRDINTDDATQIIVSIIADEPGEWVDITPAKGY